MDLNNRHYILLQSNYTVSYTNENCYTNEKIFEDENEKNIKPEELAGNLKNNFYKAFFKKHYKHLLILTAAGTSIDNGENRGKSREDLWEYCKDEIASIIDYFSSTTHKEKINAIFGNKNIEALLSYIIIYEKLNDTIEYKGKLVRKELEIKISEACKLQISSKAPHKDFLRKITARKNNDSRIQLFTTNYDTLFEQAANKAGFVIIDGFSFTHPREFSGKWFDLDIVNRDKTRLKQEESFLPEVFHLYKLHGSLNWTKYNERIIQQDNPSEPLIIYPANEKYESSYEQPYFEMMSRFQQALRKEETLLVIIGYGFQDKHINNVIIEAIEQNHSFQLLIVDYNNTGGINISNLEQLFYNLDSIVVKLGVNIVFDTFENFTKNLPENSSYINKFGYSNESV
jgi:NAD-dependent SIR2 family protein deacetylase